MLTLSKQHQGCTCETKEKAALHLDILAADLPADVYTASQSRGQILELWETTTKYLEEFAQNELEPTNGSGIVNKIVQ